MITWKNDCTISQIMDISSAKKELGRDRIHIAFALDSNTHADRLINQDERTPLFGRAKALVLCVTAITLEFDIQNLRSQDDDEIKGTGTIFFTSFISDNSDIADIDSMRELFQEKVSLTEIMDKYQINGCFADVIAGENGDSIENNRDLSSDINQLANNQFGKKLFEEFGLRLDKISVTWTNRTKEMAKNKTTARDFLQTARPVVPPNPGSKARHKKYDIFISYAHDEDDLKTLEKIISSLKDKGINVWYYPEQIKVSDDKNEKMLEGLQNANSILLFITPAYLGKMKDTNSDPHFEYQRSRDFSLKPIPIRYKTTIEQIRACSVLNNLVSQRTGIHIKEVRDYDK